MTIWDQVYYGITIFSDNKDIGQLSKLKVRGVNADAIEEQNWFDDGHKNWKNKRALFQIIWQQKEWEKEEVQDVLVMLSVEKNNKTNGNTEDST